MTSYSSPSSSGHPTTSHQQINSNNNNNNNSNNNQQQQRPSVVTASNSPASGVMRHLPHDQQSHQHLPPLAGASQQQQQQQQLSSKSSVGGPTNNHHNPGHNYTTGSPSSLVNTPSSAAANSRPLPPGIIRHQQQMTPLNSHNHHQRVVGGGGGGVLEVASFNNTNNNYSNSVKSVPNNQRSLITSNTDMAGDNIYRRPHYTSALGVHRVSSSSPNRGGGAGGGGGTACSSSEASFQQSSGLVAQISQSANISRLQLQQQQQHQQLQQLNTTQNSNSASNPNQVVVNNNNAVFDMVDGTQQQQEQASQQIELIQMMMGDGVTRRTSSASANNNNNNNNDFQQQRGRGHSLGSASVADLIDAEHYNRAMKLKKLQAQQNKNLTRGLALGGASSSPDDVNNNDDGQQQQRQQAHHRGAFCSPDDGDDEEESVESSVGEYIPSNERLAPIGRRTEAIVLNVTTKLQKLYEPEKFQAQQEKFAQQDKEKQAEIQKKLVELEKKRLERLKKEQQQKQKGESSDNTTSNNKPDETTTGNTENKDNNNKADDDNTAKAETMAEKMDITTTTSNAESEETLLHDPSKVPIKKLNDHGNTVASLSGQNTLRLATHDNSNASLPTTTGAQPTSPLTVSNAEETANNNKDDKNDNNKLMVKQDKDNNNANSGASSSPASPPSSPKPKDVEEAKSLASPSVFEFAYSVPPSSSVVRGKYQRLRTLSSGAFGVASLVQWVPDDATNPRCAPNEISTLAVTTPKVRVNDTTEVPRSTVFVCKSEKKKSAAFKNELTGAATGARIEERILANCAHPNIVAYVEEFADDNYNHLVTEYVDGGDLREEIRFRSNGGAQQQQNQNQPHQPQVGAAAPNASNNNNNNNSKPRYLSERLALSLFVQICLGVEYLHRHNILHRDLKSNNILVSKQWICKVADFGFAKEYGEHDIDSDISVAALGTPHYMAPEALNVGICGYGLQHKDARIKDFAGRYYSERSDVWSLGVILYEILELVRPFKGNTVEEVTRSVLFDLPRTMRRRDVSKFTQDLIRSLLDKNPDNRPTARDVLRMPLMQSAISNYISRFNSIACKPGATELDRMWVQVLLDHQALIADEDGGIASCKARRRTQRNRREQVHERVVSESPTIEQMNADDDTRSRVMSEIHRSRRQSRDPLYGGGAAQIRARSRSRASSVASRTSNTSSNMNNNNNLNLSNPLDQLMRTSGEMGGGGDPSSGSPGPGRLVTRAAMKQQQQQNLQLLQLQNNYNNNNDNQQTAMMLLSGSGHPKTSNSQHAVTSGKSSDVNSEHSESRGNTSPSSLNNANHNFSA